jgi:hypothetical protein
VFGGLSDRIGRKKIILAGCIIAALTYFPLFKGLTHFVNPDLEAYSKRLRSRSRPATATSTSSSVRGRVRRRATEGWDQAKYADRGVPGGTFPHEDSLHLDSAAVPHRQRLVWGMLPLLATALVAWSGNIYYGLWYPIWVPIMTFGLLLVRETRHVQIHTEH